MVTSTIVALSGRVASGKSTLGNLLLERRPGLRFSTADLIRDRAAANGQSLSTRRDLQEYGERLDQETSGDWVANALAPRIVDLPPGSLVVVDAIRVTQQIEGLRRAFGRRVAHVHLRAPVDVISERYASRVSAIEELPDYEAVGANPTEAAVDDLADQADVVIDTLRNTARDVEIRCAARLGLLPPTSGPQVDIIVGGQYGSEGKGNVGYYLAPEYDVLVRSGGPNAGHKVPVDPPFTHKLLPSGTLANESALLAIAPGATITLKDLLDEIADCAVEEDRLVIDPQTFIIEEDDRAREASDEERIGSTRSGAGAATARRILDARLNGHAYRTAGDVPELRHYVKPVGDILTDAAARGSTVLLEGTQGSGLSLYHGSYPHVTSRDTNVGGLLAEAGLPASAVRRVILTLRTYPIRVGGNSGPMGSEINFAVVAERCGLPLEEIKTTEVGSVSHRPRRVAEFDWTLLRRSAELNGATDVALTFVDYLDCANRHAYRFEQLTSGTRAFVEELELVTGCPVSLLSTNFGHGRGLIDRRPWRGAASRFEARG